MYGDGRFGPVIERIDRYTLTREGPGCSPAASAFRFCTTVGRKRADDGADTLNFHIMITWVATFGIIYLAGFALMARAVKNSCEGYEDERGFNLGRPPERDDDPEAFR